MDTNRILFNETDKLKELTERELKSIEGGVIGIAVACGILFVGSVALGFAVGSRMWK